VRWNLLITEARTLVNAPRTMPRANDRE
jgi:hypothetical protein